LGEAERLATESPEWIVAERFFHQAGPRSMESVIPDQATRAQLRNGRLSLRARLMMLVVASVVPMVVFTLARGYLDYQDDVASAGRKTLELARSLALSVEKQQQARIAALQVLAQSTGLRRGDLDVFRARAEAVVADQFPGSNIVLLREDGTQVLNTLVPAGAPLPRRPNIEATKAVFATGRPAISNVYLGVAAHRYVISIEVPVRGADGAIIYSLSLVPQKDSFGDAMRSPGLSDSWVISVFDREGVNVARNLNPERFVGQKAGPGLLERMLTKPEDIFVNTSREGIELVTAFSRLPASGWTVAMGVPLAELTAPAIHAAVRTLAVSGAVLGLGLLLAIVVTRQILRPMATLRRLATAEHRSEILDAPATGLSEADDVVRALQAAELARQRSEQEVLDRSTQLESSNRRLEAEVDVRQKAEEKAHAQLTRLNLLHQITRAIGERQDLNSIFQVVVRSLEDELPVDLACMCLHDGTDQSLTVARIGVKSSVLAFGLAMPERARIDIDQNGLSRCVAGDLVYEPDIGRLDFPFPQRLSRVGLRSLVLAPLQVESRVFGVLVAARREAHGFSSGECEFLRQLSEHVALAAHQAQIYEALQQAYQDLQQTQQAVMQQERLRALGQMASGIAHDINNALSPVTLYTQVLLEMEPGLSADARESLETIERAVDDVAHTVARMSEFYRQREPQLTLVAVQLNQLVQHVIDLTRARWSDMAQQRGTVIALETELAEAPPPILGVESEIREALTNLIFNAVDAMPNGGTLTLRTRVVRSDAGSRHDELLVDVGDDGAGMDEETRRRCMEPFFTTKGERGTGLGLAMVYGVARRHNAEVEIESAVGKGTVVSLSFPVPSAEQVASPGKSTGFAMPPRMRLLLVDDDPLLLKSMRDTLQADGHVVVTTTGGAAGIAAFRAAMAAGETFGAVITDLGMPNIDGRKVAAAIKDASPATPVIMLTGWGRRLQSEADIPAHVDYVLSKPPRLRELRETLVLCSGASAKAAQEAKEVRGAQERGAGR
jgi:signal transduction histidine kinase/CheY-like chemotaxis protein